MAAAGLCAQAFVNPEIYPGASWHAISPDGRYLESNVYGTMVIYDLTTGVEWTYELGGETGTSSYSAGNGNNFSATGILVGSITDNGTAAYWKEGEWHLLDVIDPTMGNLANGITNDGTRICGCLGTAEMQINDDTLMGVPCVWDLQSDGTYGEPVVLPHPELDPTGRVPQYVTAVSISADGKTVAGQMTGATGFIQYPIIFTLGDDGKWSYKLLMEKEMCPEDIVFPPYPGEGPDQPQKTDFMTAEEKASHEAAVDAWAASGWSTPYPEEYDYMTAEEIAAYEKAVAEYEPLYAAWEEASNAWYAKLEELLETIPLFEFNDALMTPDGSSYVSTLTVTDPMSWPPTSVYTPGWIDIASDSYVTVESGGKSIYINWIVNDDLFLGTTGLSSVPMTSYLITREGKVTEMAEYLKGLDENFATWMDENLKHEMLEYEEDENGEVIEVTNEYLFTGAAITTPDMKTLALWCQDVWEYQEVAYGYVFNLGEYQGVNDVVTAAGNRISFDANGNLNVEGNGVKAVTVYDLQGRKVLDSAVGDGTISNDLRGGVYIIRATTDRGVSFSSKIVK